MGVELSHHLADDARALDVPAIGPQSHVCHLEEDAPLHRLEPVACIGKCAGVDHRVGVLEERALHFSCDVDILDPLGDLSGLGGTG